VLGKIASLATKAIPVVGTVVTIATIIVEVAVIVKKVRSRA
jgi:hypothetical protein